MPVSFLRLSRWFPTYVLFQFEWPVEITGLERIALSAQGDLQRVLRSVTNLLLTTQPLQADAFIYAARSSHAPSTLYPSTPTLSSN